MRLDEDVKLTAASRQARSLAEKILQKESLAAAQGKDSVLEATAEKSLGDLLVSENDLGRASTAYSKAVVAWSATACRAETIGSLMDWAKTLHSMGGKQTEMEEVLGRALSIAEADDGRPSDIGRTLSYFAYRPVWKDATLANRKRYLEFKKALLKGGSEHNRWQMQELAEESEALQDWDLASVLYSELLSSSQGYERKRYLESLARVSDKLGRKTEAAAYRRSAQLLGLRSVAPGALGLPAGPAYGASQPSAQPRGSRRNPPPWSPPTVEHPGSEGGTPGLQPQQPQGPGTEGGTPGEKDKPPPPQGAV
jgi:hypothetical protein